MDDRDPAALPVAAAAAGEECGWHEMVDRYAAAAADPPLCYARIGPAPAKVPVAAGASACDHARERWGA